MSIVAEKSILVPSESAEHINMRIVSLPSNSTSRFKSSVFSSFKPVMAMSLAIGVSLVSAPATVHAGVVTRVIDRPTPISTISTINMYSPRQSEHTLEVKGELKEAGGTMKKDSAIVKAKVVNLGYQKHRLSFNEDDDNFEEELPLIRRQNHRTVKATAKIENKGYQKHALNLWEDEE